MVRAAGFEWDEAKDAENQRKHGVSFTQAQLAFADPNRLLSEDVRHSFAEKRYYCIGRIDGGVLTVRFTLRDGNVRIIGAGFWRKAAAFHEKENRLH